MLYLRLLVQHCKTILAFKNLVLSEKCTLKALRSTLIQKNGTCYICIISYMIELLILMHGSLVQWFPNPNYWDRKSVLLMFTMFL